MMNVHTTAVQHHIVITTFVITMWCTNCIVLVQQQQCVTCLPQTLPFCPAINTWPSHHHIYLALMTPLWPSRHSPFSSSTLYIHVTYARRVANTEIENATPLRSSNIKTICETAPPVLGWQQIIWDVASPFYNYWQQEDLNHHNPQVLIRVAQCCVWYLQQC